MTMIKASDFGISDSDLAGDWCFGHDPRIVSKMVMVDGLCYFIQGFVTKTDPKSGLCEIRLTSIERMKPN